ncbi:unnamed protein product [Rotaria sordida]|uniref:Interferon-induced very large GTPase 1-like n=1 Tax=Rotaria sordida TaxID=392033 RepID=A0A819EUV5_9BILA|nr:unnamed protein product [Rotaria sordida]
MDKIENYRTATLQRKKGETFGFSLGRAIEDGVEFRLDEGLPTLHKIMNVLKNGYAHKASLRNDDRLIEINGQDVKSKSFVECVRLLQNTGDTVTIKVIRLSGENTISLSVQPSIIITDTIFNGDNDHNRYNRLNEHNAERSAEKQSLNINIPDFLKPNRCIYSIKVDYNDSSTIQCFEILKPYCQNLEGLVHPTFNTIVNEPLDANILSQILSNQISPAETLTAYVVDSLKRHHALNDIVVLLSEALESLVESGTGNKYEILVDQLTKRMLLVQTLENMSYDSQRFLCNFIRKNDLPIPLSYQFWNSTEKTMYHRINFNCLMETLCVTDLHVVLQFGSPSASGLGKTSLIGYLFNDKRRESFFTDTADCSWRDGCVDVLFADQFTIFDVHGKATDTRLIRSIQPYTYVQIIYVTEEDLNGDFLESNVMKVVPNIQTIVVVFDRNYDDVELSMKLIKHFKDKFTQWTNIQWTSAPMFNTYNSLPTRKIAQRNKRLREKFDQLLKRIKSYVQEPLFRSCFQIQSSFYEKNSNLTPIKLVFEIETELDHLFSQLSDKTENLLLVTPISYQKSQIKVSNASSYESRQLERIVSNSTVNDVSRSIQTSSIINKYHAFTISLLNHRTYIELLIVEAYLEKWRAAYVPSLRNKQEQLRENASAILRQLKQAERENATPSEATGLRQQYEMLLNQLRNVDSCLMNVDLTFGLFCDELFALWDHIHRTQTSSEIKNLQNKFNLVATKLAELVYKGFALHILRGRPLQSHSRLLKMCMEKLNLGDSVSILTVVGEQSSAKSSLLNSTFGCNFRVSAGRCTLGLYLGLAYYKNMTIIILDTEGLMSLEESGSIFDNQMVTMAVLSSNLVLINHKGEISSSLEGLIGMSLYAKIQIQSSPFKPKLLFVLRDQTQRDMKIFQQQLNRLKDNIQRNGQFLQMSIDDELEMKHIILMPGAFTEDTNRDYGIVQKWRTETFSMEINKLRTNVFKCLEEQMNEKVNMNFTQRNLSNSINSRKNFDAYFYSKLTTNWKSIDDLGKGLLQCQSLYELSVQNELKSIAANIIVERQNQLQRIGSDLIEKLIKEKDQLMNTNLDTSNNLKPHLWLQQIVQEGTINLSKLINEHAEDALKDYEEQTQHSYFKHIKKYEKTIQASIKNMQQYLYEHLEMRALEMTLKTIQDYYRRELLNIKVTIKISNEFPMRLNQRVQELKIEITDSLQAYKRSKKTIIKSALDVYKNVIRTKNENKYRNNTYNLCPLLDYNKYLEIIQELDIIINKYVHKYIEQNGRSNSSQVTITPRSPSMIATNISPFAFPLEDQNVFHWVNNFNASSKNQQTIHFVFSVLLNLINDRLDISPLHLAYSDPKMIDDLIEIINCELRSAKLDLSHINRPALIRDLIIFTLYMLVEKTNQRFELKTKQLLTETFNHLEQVKENLLEQMNKDKKTNNQANLFRRIIGKEIIYELGRINRQKLIEEIRTKLNEYYSINPTDITRQIYSESIASQPIKPLSILKFVSDPNDITTTLTAYMLLIMDVVLNSECTDTHVLHNQVLQQIVSAIPDFQASRKIEIERIIENPDQFQEYFKNLDLFQGEMDNVLLQELAKVREEFSQAVIPECFETLFYQLIGCTSRCPGCGIKCELPAKIDPSEEHHHCSQHHLPMAFNGWSRNKQLHPHLSMCYQQWKTKTLFRDDNSMSSPEEFFSSEASDWYKDVKKKSETGEACSEQYPLIEQRRAWMAVRYKLLKEFELQDPENYHSGIYPTTIVSVPNNIEVLWESL